MPERTLIGLVTITMACSSSAAPGSSDGGQGDGQPDSRGQEGCIRTYGPMNVADVQGDGNADLVVVTPSGNMRDIGDLSVLPGNGDGTFRSPINTPFGRRISSVSVVDVNGDKKLDLVICNTLPFDGGGATSLLLGDGGGSFQPSIDYPGMYCPAAMTDLNHDGIVDAVSMSESPPQHQGDDLEVRVRSQIGNGDGTFRAPLEVLFVAPKVLLGRPVVADINGDGNVDILATDEKQDGTGEGVHLVFGNGDGTFNGTRSGARTTQRPRRVLVTDVNSDSKPDIIAWSLSAYSVVLGSGAGSFQAPDTHSFARLAWLAAGDVSSDGSPDLFVIAFDMVSVLLGRSDGKFQHKIDYPFTGLYHGPSIYYQPVLTDVNGDGRPDLVIPTNTEDTPDGIDLLLGNGDGTFQDMQCVRASSVDM